MNNKEFDTIFTVNPAIQNDIAPQPLYEFHVSREIRERCQFDGTLFSTTGNVILANLKNVRIFAKKVNDTIDPVLHPEQMLKAGQLNAMGLIDEIFHYVCYLYRKQANHKAFETALVELDAQFTKEAVDQMLLEFTTEFPPLDVYRSTIFPETYLESINPATGITNRITTLEELVLLHLANENPAFKPFLLLFNDYKLALNPLYTTAWNAVKDYFKTQPVFGPKNNDLITMLKEPVAYSPHSLKGQLDYIRTYWADLLGEWLKRLLAGIDLISEEEKPGWSGGIGFTPQMDAPNYDYLSKEYERYSPDRDWMPRVVLMAKTVLVWLNQLSEKYQRPITRLDQIPDEEIDILAQRGFTGLWLIGLWERSHASQRIKQINGNPEAASSAYSLFDYDIAWNLGGWEALDNLRMRCWQRGIRLASDMVPNHTAMDGRWVVEHPDLFIQRRDCPFPTYTFNGENLSQDNRVSIYLEDHYYQKSDCSVVFKRIDNSTGDTRYIYHGNDGTGMPWNDTAQIDFLNPQAREEVIQKILHVARNFPIIRFDAAMVLAKKHIKRLWYPEPGCGGDIATRSESALNREEFENRIPNEFWREVVDRCAKEIPDTLLLAEAFWMMEGYFVRTLGMHRVYNSAFMNMLKKEENYKYRQTVKNTLEFDPQVLRRFVNFMNNPDEETAVAQFGKGDKYFGVCTLMITMPGLPMFGHGQIEGFTEKYGMEYQKAYWKETPDQDLIDRHERDIFPLMKKRYLFADVTHFCFYDVWDNGSVNENVFAYSNSFGKEKAIVFYNNVYQCACGWIKESCHYAVKTGDDAVQQKTCDLGDALELAYDASAFCIFREQRSGLWYIRTNCEIHDNGLFVNLKGFESQVLMDFKQVFDDGTGKYRILYEALNGKGVEDIEVALQETFLKDLYQTLSAFAKLELFAGFNELCKPELVKKQAQFTTPCKTLPELLAKAKPDALAYFDKLAEFISGNYGAAQISGISTAGTPLSGEKTWELFASQLQTILEIKAEAEKSAPAENAQNTAFCKQMYEIILSKPHMSDYLVIFAILNCTGSVIGKKATPAMARNLICLWGLNRKLFRILKEESLTDSYAYIAARLLPESIACSRLPVESKATTAAYIELQQLFSYPEAFAITGLNTFNGVRWFGKEQMEDALNITTLVQFLCCTSEAEQTAVRALHKALQTAKEKAEFNADNFLKAFAPAKAAKATVKPRAKAASETSKTAAKEKAPKAKSESKKQKK